ncbi:hypothetical protein [Streptomyces pseudogriseolus]|uniref:hypothetical protein n=1 Tax=Streptomyces pseudogriseolus TaxID=36817 RepID=UPI000A39673F
MTNSKPLPRRGRPPLLTADLIKDIAAAAEQGMNRREIAAAVQVGYASLMRWLAEGRRLRDAGVDGSALMGHDWLCLRLVKCVEDAEQVRRVNKVSVREVKPTGRPPLLNEDLVDVVVRSVEAGDGRAVAAAAAGVTPRTLQRWLARGARSRIGGASSEYERLCADLHRRVAVVEGSGESGPVGLELKGVGCACVPGELLEAYEVKADQRPMLLPEKPTVYHFKAPEQAAAGGPLVIDLSRRRGRIRSWLRSRLHRTAKTL